MTPIMWVSYYIIKLLQQQLKTEKYYGRFLQSICFLARQSLAFPENWSNDSKSEESNFHQLLLLRSLDDQGGAIPDRR